MTRDELCRQWEEKARRALKGRKIVQVRYMTVQEQGEMAWCRSAVVLVLDNGVELSPMQDDEGNGPGAMMTNLKALPTIPVL